MADKMREAPTLFEIASDLECVDVELLRVDDLLQIFEEHIEEEVSFLKNQNAHPSYFVGRYDLLRSLLDAAQISLHETTKTLRDQIDTIYDAHQKKGGG